MQLKSIKLAGFKSFAEPTHIPLPGRLIGVVGPNGCGKSNVIDAVRWVLGESQARQLRGETLQDVIFGGSSARPALGRASVELIFDNSDGRAPGQWSPYAEIAVRRVLVREGNSQYFINQQQVRRRDVQDMFLGTGLGPRAYAIIEQGMISRIVESRPEEIRVFLEEAAGVSRYRERRRETEHRLEDARAHLTRTADVRQELDQQIEKLNRQAQAARHWQSLQDRLLRVRQLQTCQRLEETRAGAERLVRELKRAELEQERALSEVARLESLMACQRLELQSKTEELSGAQGALYQINAVVAQLETRIESQRTAHARLQAELLRLRHEQERDQERSAQLRERLEQNETVLGQAVERKEWVELQEHQEQERLPGIEAAAQTARQAVEQLRDRVQQVQERLTSADSGRRTGQRLLEQLSQRQQRLQDELAQWALSCQECPDLSDYPRLIRAGAVRIAIEQSIRQDCGKRLRFCESKLELAQQNENQARRDLTQLEARFKALEALQRRSATLEQAQAFWQEHGLEQIPPLWQELEVEPGWEKGLEGALEARLNARPCSPLGPVLEAIPADGAVSGAVLYDLHGLDWHEPDLIPGGVDSYAAQESCAPLVPLWHRVETRAPALTGYLRFCLEQTYCVDSLLEARRWQTHLAPGQRLVTPEGHVLDVCTLVLFAPDARLQGALARARELNELDLELAQVRLRSDQAQEGTRRAKSIHATVRSEQALSAERIRAEEGQVHQHSMQWERWSSRQEQQAQRRQQLEESWRELNSQIVQETQHLQGCEQEWQGARQELDRYQAEREPLEQIWLTAEQERDAQRLAANSATHAVREAELLVRSETHQRQELEHSMNALQRHAQERSERQRPLEIELESWNEGALVAERDQQVVWRMQREQALLLARQTLEQEQEKLQALDRERLEWAQQLEPLRQCLHGFQLKLQELRLLEQQAQAELVADAVDLGELLKDCEAGVNKEGLKRELSELQTRIAQIGPVNLAAVPELEVAQNRASWLALQVADLQQAVDTLEGAMRRIDRETREQLRETFERVDAGYRVLFPTLFGGGQGRIELTGSEILDAGIQIVAQPPGKKTASLHLLSGGEKALTALALIFALFQLNPAPFCLLDEVDAPLDDANTERFASLVRQMSHHTQFLFITHNKIAMEMAQQLVGVTMAESGVSRMVAVDIEAAVRLAESVVV